MISIIDWNDKINTGVITSLHTPVSTAHQMFLVLCMIYEFTFCWRVQLTLNSANFQPHMDSLIHLQEFL